MNEVAIHVSGVSKVYRIWARPQMRVSGPLAQRTSQWVILPKKLRDPLLQHARQACYEFYALRDVSLEVRRGETMGIVGRNGSGKSTLLQIIAGILQPTSGEMAAQGRVAALLELGSGFNPEFTGRENVYLNAAVLGLTRREINERFDGIAAFADIGEFLEQPVKTYSSGMMLRLAFAVQTAVDPQILIIDEALAVGDESFQRKCFARLEKLRDSGVTILFVSHSLGSVVNLCRRAIWLHHGEIVMEGKPKDVVGRYQKFSHSSEEKAEEVLAQIKQEVAQTAALAEGYNGASVAETMATADFDPALLPKSTISYESLGAEITEPGIYDEKNRKVNILTRRGFYTYRYRVKFSEDCHNVFFAMVIKTMDGTELGGARSVPQKEELKFVKEGSVYLASFRFQCLLAPGTYFLNSGVEGQAEGEEVFYAHRVLDIYSFKILPETEPIPTATVDFLIEPACQLVGGL